jgi:hypothetical protein
MCRRAARGEGFNGERQPGLAAQGMSTTELLERLGRSVWIRAVYSGSVHHTVEAAKTVL